MKLANSILIATVLAGCSSSSSDRPGSIDERQERIANERAERDRDQLYGPRAPELESDFDSDNDGIADADEAGTGAVQNPIAGDRDPNALTPMDQSNSSRDVEITQAIRKKVIDADDLSFNAKNVKIITVSGKVTLRGPVESAEERSAIERTARDVAGVRNVDNQLEVK